MSRHVATLRCVFVVVALMLAASSPPMANAAETYPSRPIRLLIGFGAGGPTDIPARYVADKLTEVLGQRVVVENKPAAGGIMATRDLIAQPADGYTLLLCTHFDPINVAVYRNVGFKLSDIAPVSLIAEYYYGLALANAVPADSLEGFITYAKAHPGEVTYATIGAGSAQEIMARQLEKLTGITMNRIPFRGGPQVVQELVAGRLNFYVSPTLAIMPQYRSGQIKVLATTSPQRLNGFADVPTLKEHGIDFVRLGYLGICAAKGTPEPIVKTLHDHIAPIVASAEYHAIVEKAGTIAISSTPQEFSALIGRMSQELRASIQEFGMEQDQ